MSVTHHLCENTPAFSAQLSDDQVIELCLAGKIIRCEAQHEGTTYENEYVYHVTPNYRIAQERIQELIVRAKA